MKKFSIAKSVAIFALALLMAVSSAAFAPPVYAAGENLTVTIHNGSGLPEMEETQFKVYQIFTGRANREDDPQQPADAEQDLWNATEWDNWSLAGIEWGSSVADGTALTGKLAALDPKEQSWLGTANPFADAKSARDIAAKLLEQNNVFLQGFSKWLLNDGGLTSVEATPGYEIQVTPGPAGDHSKDQTVITVPEPGYYLFAQQEKTPDPKNSVISEFILTVLGNQEVDLKGDVPVITKTIANTFHHDKADVIEADTSLTFRLSGTLPKNLADYPEYFYEFHDTLPKGLTYGDPDGNLGAPGHPAPDAGITVQLIRGQFAYTLAENEYTVSPSAPDPSAPGKEKEITFTFQNLRKELNYTEQTSTEPLGPGVAGGGKITPQAGDQIVITYSATLNEDAEAGYGTDGRPNKNVAYLEYSNNPNADDFAEETGVTLEDEAHVYTFALDMKKVGDDPTHESGLEGAGFILSLGDPALASDEAAFIAKLAEEEDGKRGILVWEDLDSEEAEHSAFVELYAAYEQAASDYAKATNAERAAKKLELDAAIANLAPYVVISDASGQFPEIVGLGEAETDFPYVLTEVITPDGYETMDPVTIEVQAIVGGDDTEADADSTDGDGILTELHYTISGEEKTLKLNDDTEDAFRDGKIPVTLVNRKAPILPHTGGIGAAVVFSVSAMGILTGVVILVLALRKRDRGIQ